MLSRDYENIRDISSLSDEELRRLVREQLNRQRAFDPADITVSAEDGRVSLSGRVGTDVERRIAERFVTDVLGIRSLDNQLVVDPIRRAVSPEAIDDHLVDEEEHEGLLLGDRSRPFSPEAEHLHEDDEDEVYGTTDVQAAIEGATPWIPPESPTPEGLDDQPRP
jgi:hypothetical protein